VVVLRVLALFLVPLLLAASTFGDPDRKIWERIIHDVHLPGYRIYTPDPDMRRLLRKIRDIEIVERCEDATLAIETKEAKIPAGQCKNVPILTDSYRIFLEDKRAIGAFFWLKSRPTILFSAPRIERFHVDLDKEMQNYLEDIQ
jgi:hypothetical protein